MKIVIRIIIYLLGLAFLSFGVVMNTKTGLGVSPLNALPYSISQMSGKSLGNITIIVYMVYIIIEIIILKKEFQIYQSLQVPCSLLFGKYTDLFGKYIVYLPDNQMDQVVVLLTAIFFTALGVVLTVSMKIVPNAPDGLTQIIADKTKKEFGFVKNFFDFASVLMTVIVCIIFGERIIGIGIGTLVATLMIGRTISVLNKLLKEKLQKWCSISI